MRYRIIPLILTALAVGCTDSMSPLRPASIEAASLTEQYATVGSSISILPSVVVTDSVGNPIRGASVTFTVSGAGSISDSVVKTDEYGAAKLNAWTVGSSPGTTTVTARASGLPQSVLFKTTILPAGFALKTVWAGNQATCGLANDQLAYCWGAGGFGSLGAGDELSRFTPTPVAGGIKFQTVVGGRRMCGLTLQGAAYCWGYYIPEQTPGNLVKSPVAVPGGLTFQMISGNGTHTCGLTAAGKAYCWGINTQGQLGDSTRDDRSSPTPVAGGLTFRTISAGGLNTCGITTSGQTYCWGYDVATTLFAVNTTPILVPGGVSFESVVAGASGHNCGLTSTGKAYCWGNNGFGQLGDGTASAPRSTPVAVVGGLSFKSLSLGRNSTCGILLSGEAYCWGENTSGQLGDGTKVNRSQPVLSAPGLKFQSLSTSLQTCGVTISGHTYCWGVNTSGEMGNGSRDIGSAVPVPVVGQ